MGFWWITDDLILILRLADYRSCYLVSMRCCRRRQPSGKDPLLADLGRWIVGTQRVCIGPHSARQPSSFLLPLTAYMGVNCQPNWHLKYGKSSRGGGSLNYCLLGCRLPKRSVCRAGLPDIRLLLGTWKLCSLEHVRVQSFCRTVAP